MPIYTFRCTSGHTFDIIGKLDGSDTPKTCSKVDEDMTRQLHVETVCGLPVQKEMALNAKSFPGADSWRK